MQKPTADGGCLLSSVEVVRERFLAAWDDSLARGSDEPSIDRYLEPLPEAERTRLRPQLESFQRIYRSRRSSGEGGARPSVAEPAEASPASDSRRSTDFDPFPPPEPLTVGRPPGPDPDAPTVGQSPGANTERSDERPAHHGDAERPSHGSGLRDKARPSAPGTVAGYEILDTLGRGAMGVVYKARQPGLNRIVALKMILAGDHAGDREIARFLIEAEAVAQLQHPHIVQIYEIGEDDGKPYFSLEFVDGTSLARLIDGNPQPPRRAAEFALQLARGMAAAHAKGIIHRDLKPANVLVGRDDVAKITDFGLAKKLDAASGQTHVGAVLGTPSYMPPEQARGHSEGVGPLSDVYSLGAILYELLTGRPPFQGATPLETLDMVRGQEPVAPTQLQPKLPKDLETICLKSLHKDASRRYASAEALAEDLECFLDGRPIQARPVGAAERAVRWCRRNPRVALLSAAVVLLVIVWAGTSSALAFLANENRKEAEQNKREAETQRDRALASQKEAERSAREAERNAQAARTTSERVLEKMIQLGEAMQIKLNSRLLSERLGPEARGLQQSMIGLLRDRMLEISRELGDQKIRNFGAAASYQKLGDLLAHLGQGTEALRQYERAFDLVKGVAEKEPDNDLARANMGVMLMRLGDMALDLDGDARAARDRYQRGWDLQHTIALHPKTRDFTPDKNLILLSHHAARIGKADLALGDAAAATRQFETALKNRTEWMTAHKNSPESRSYVAEAYLWLGVAAWHRGDMAAGESNLREAVRRCEELAKELPNYVPFRADLADVSGRLGDLQTRLGKFGEAAESYGRAQAALDAALARRPDDPQWLPAVASQQERLGAEALRLGHRTEADEHFARALKVREELALLEPSNRVWRAAQALALARAGKPAEAIKLADNLEREAGKSAEILLQLARCHAACASEAASDADKRREIERALALVKGAGDLGYRDRAVVRTDPDLAILRAEPGFAALAEEPASTGR